MGDATGIREYKGAAKATTITAGITSGSTSFSIDDSTGWPTGAVGNFIATSDGGTSSEEKMLCSALAGGIITVVTRGYDNTSAVAHASGSTFVHTISAIDIAEANYIANFHAATSKATPIDADEIPLADSAATFGLKKLTWANIKATLLTYFNSVAQVLTNKDLTSATNTVSTERLLSTTTLSGASTTISGISQLYRNLRIVIKDINPSLAAQLTFTTGVAKTYRGAYTYRVNNAGGNGNFSNASAQLSMGDSLLAADTNNLHILELPLYSTVMTKRIIRFNTSFIDASADPNVTGVGQIDFYDAAAVAFADITFAVSAGVFNDGTVLIYGSM